MYYEFHFWWTIVLIVVVMGVLQGTAAYLILLERKLSAWVQDRLGPNRVGPFGLLQPLADGAKFILKEEIIPGHVDRLFYLLAPGIAVATAYMAFVPVPFGPTTAPPQPPQLHDLRAGATLPERALHDQARQAFDTAYHEPQKSYDLALPESPGALTGAEKDQYNAARADYQEQFRNFEPYHAQLAEHQQQGQFVIAPHLDIGILFVFSVSSLAVYGIILGGWSSNNKYSILGALRSSAQFISYELPMGMSVLGIVLLAGSLNLEKIIQRQANETWFIFYQPLAFLLFLIAIFAECNRLPFDLPEAEQELVGGYHTEYSAMKFAMFFLGEYQHMITTSFLAVVLFFGGWHFPFVAEPSGWIVPKILVFAAKMSLFIVFYMLIRWTLPRFRFDQLMALAWKGLVPLALVNLLAVMIVEQLIRVEGLNPHFRWALLPLSLLILGGAALLHLYKPKGPEQRLTVTRGHERVEITVN